MTEKRYILRSSDIENEYGMGRSLFYKEMAKGNFPKSFKLTSATGRSGASGWLESEVRAYFQQRIAESRPAPDADISLIPPADHGLGSPGIQDRG